MLSPTEYQKVKAVFDAKGIPEFIWYPIMLMESGGNPGSRANTSKEDSRGLFQINVKAHPQWKNTDLYDPVTNAKIAAENFIGPAYGKALSERARGNDSLKNEADLAAYVWRFGIRPKWTDEKNKSIREKVTEFLSGGGDPLKTPADTIKENIIGDWKEFGNELIDRFKTFSWTFIPLIVGLIILVFTLKSMFLSNTPIIELGGESK